MGQSEESFLNSTFYKVMALIQLHLNTKYGKRENSQSKVIQCNDLNDFL